MPELPEAEVVRRGLAAHLTGATFKEVQIAHARATRGQDGDLAILLRGRRIEALRRRGKFIWMQLDNAAECDALNVHLGMSGQMLLGGPGFYSGPHARIRAAMDTPQGMLDLVFVDQRTFGRWLLTPTVDGIPLPVLHIAHDPLEADFDPIATARLIRSKRSEIKRVLLDQTVVSGIGNIYADEALWQARIHPQQKANRARQSDVVKLLDAARDVMERSLAQGGTSFDSLYVNVNGSSGYFARSLNAYGRAGKACRRCGDTLVKQMIGGRSATWCPHCQRRR